MGREVMDGLHFLTSLPLAGTGQREGGGFSCMNKQIISHPASPRARIVSEIFHVPTLFTQPKW